MDIKRNKRFFDPTFSRKLIAVAVCGAALTLICLTVWWYIWISSLVSTLLTIGAIIGVGMIIGAISIRPKAKDISDQVENARTAFRDSTAEKLNFPNDFDEDSLLLWGFINGTAEKTLKGGEKYTDRVQFALLYLKRSQLYVRTEICSLTDESNVTNEYALPLSGMTLSVDESSRTLTIHTPDELLTIALYAVDYQLEEYIAKVERQIKKAI